MGAAFEQFKESIELATALKKLERDHYPSSTTIAQQPAIKGLRGGSAVLMVAAFEFFLKRLFEENISTLNSVPVTVDFNKLPEKLRIKAVFQGLNNAMAGPRYGEKPPKVDRLDDILAASKLLINGHIDPGTFSETGSNPNGSTVKEKFKDVGITDIFAIIKSDFEKKWKNVVSHDFILETLNSIVLTRHVVAHTADTLKISKKSQNDSLKFLKILAELLEKELQQHIKQVKKKAKNK